MEITRIEDDNGITLRLRGCLDTAATAEFAAALETADTAKCITLDMKELEFIASSALRLLVATRKKRGDECAIVLSGVNDVVGEVLDVTGLNEVFTIVK